MSRVVLFEIHAIRPKRAAYIYTDILDGKLKME